MKKVNNHLQIQTKSLQILKVSKKKFCSLTQVCSQSSPHIRFRSALLHQLIHHFSRCLPVSIVAHPTQGDQPLAPHWPPKMSQCKWVRPQHRTGSLYSGSLQGVDWPMQLFRQCTRVTVQG